MPFTEDQIEDGTGVAGAVVYARRGSDDPVGDAEAYLALQGRTAFVSLGAATIGAVLAKEVHLVRGVRYVENEARRRILGSPATITQTLLMPRFNLVVDERTLDSDRVPELYLNACWEAAELSATGEPLGNVVEDKRNVKRERTGRSLETEWYAGGGVKRKSYELVADLIAPFLRPAGSPLRG